MVEEIFGPVITVGLRVLYNLRIPTLAAQAYVYKDEDFDKTLELVDSTSQYALTGAL